MGSFPSDNRASVSRHKAARRDDPAKSLYDHANRFFLSLAGRADDRDFFPPEKTESRRDRQTLAQFIEIIEPDEADRISLKLLDEFGSIGRMLGASEAALHRVLAGNNAVLRLIKATEKFMVANLADDLPRTLISATDQQLVDYLRAKIGYRSTETMLILFLDSANRLLIDQEFGEGSPRRIFVQPRTILKRALELDASGMILVHNHPGGNALPSKKDIEFTRSINALCSELEICLHDHIIISSDHWVSFRKLKII